MNRARTLFFLLFVLQLKLDCLGQHYKVTPFMEESKIINGIIAADNELPYQVSVQNVFGSHFCGGSLITFRHVLTAGHCVFRGTVMLRPSSVQVLAGTNNICFCMGQGKRLYASEIIPHEGYNFDETGFDNDLAILVLGGSFKRQPGIDVIPIKTTAPTVGELCLVSGWGVTEKGNTLELMKVTVPIYNHLNCSIVYSPAVTNNMVCAGYPEGGKDACQGDSGGPLTCNNQLSGIVSFGNDCALPLYPGVYTKVVNYIDWIKNKTGYICADEGRMERMDQGDTNIFITEAPYQVYILKSDESYCSGALINMGHVLTSASCVQGDDLTNTTVSIKASQLTVIAGVSFYPSDSDEVMHVRNVTSITINSGYTSAKAHGSNIAIIKLSTPFEKTTHVSDVELQTTELHLCDDCEVTKWIFSMLFRSTVSIYDREPECGSANDTIVCTYDGENVCEVYEGAPLVCNGLLSGVWTGATDDAACASKTSANATPLRYVDVRRHAEWIARHSHASRPLVALALLTLPALLLAASMQ